MTHMQYRGVAPHPLSFLKKEIQSIEEQDRISHMQYGEMATSPLAILKKKIQSIEEQARMSGWDEKQALGEEANVNKGNLAFK